MIGALAALPAPVDRGESISSAPDDGRVIATGFAALDAILGPGGIPRLASVSLRGDHSSGKTTLALRFVAEAQSGGAIVAWLDLTRAFDPVEAVARGVQPEWLVVLTPASPDEGLAMAGMLLQGRAVDLLLIDLPPDLRSGPPPSRHASGRRPPAIADRLHRLAALARRAGTLFVVLEPPRLPQGVTAALSEAVGLRLDLARRTWLRLGRDVVGQQTEVVVDRNRFGPPGRRADLRILYADGGDRDTCLAVPGLIRETPLDAQPGRSSPAPPIPLKSPTHLASRVRRDETPAPALAPSPSAAHPRALGAGTRHALPIGADRVGRAALDEWRRAGPQRPRGRDGDPARHAARERAPAGAGGGLPRS